MRELQGPSSAITKGWAGATGGDPGSKFIESDGYKSVKAGVNRGRSR